jgi:hypothetical protein
MSRFWPASEPSQLAYERLRAAAVNPDQAPDQLAAARFGRRGLSGLIAWPDAEPVFWVGLVGAARPAWTPYSDPRLGALAATYRLLLGSAADRSSHQGTPSMTSGGRP